MCVSFFVAGSYIASCRPDRVTGNSFADSWADPALQKAGLSDGRMVSVIHTRPRPSSIALCTFALLVQCALSPQYTLGAPWFGPAATGVFGSRTVSGTRVTVLCTGSSTGR